MFQPNFDESVDGNPSARLGNFAFVVGDPAEVRSVTPRDERDMARQPGGDDETKWLNERLTACYND